MSGTTVYTSTHYTAVGTNYCWIYGCCDYYTTNYDDKVRVTSDWVGEAWTEGPGTYTENASSTTTVTVNGTTCTTGTLSSARTKTIAEGVWTYVKAGGSSSNYVDVAKGTSAKSVNLVLTYSIRGSSYTKTVSISIPALATYSVSYNANGGSGAPTSQTKTYGKTLTLSSTTPTRSGWTFQGWGTSATDTTVDYSPGGSYTANSAATLYAIWKKDLTLSYSANGGSGAPSSQTKSIYNATTSATFTIPSTPPTRQYYKFTGWKTGSTTYQPSDNITIPSNTTLTAQWTEDYIPPKFVSGSVSAYRTTDSSGSTNNGTGSYARLQFAWTKGSLAGSTLTTTAKATYKEHGSSATPTTITTSTGTSVDTVFGGGNLAADKQYDITLTLSVSGYPDVTQTTYISTENFTIDVNADGTNIGLLMVAPDDSTLDDNLGIYFGKSVDVQRGTANRWVGYKATRTDTNQSVSLQVGAGGTNSGVYWNSKGRWMLYGSTSGDVYINVDVLKVSEDGTVYINSQPIADFVVEEGSVEKTGITWRYQKWNSGKAEFWGVRLWSSQAVNTAWGSVYYVNLGKVDFPFSLTTVNAVVNIGNRSTSARGWFLEDTGRTVSSTGSLYFVTPSVYSNIASVVADIHVTGKWKT